MQIGRLAFREEGTNWNCYYATPDSMGNAVFLGSIAMRFVSTQERRDQFIVFMRECFSDLVEETTGVRPTWPDGVIPAPEHERTYHG